MAPKCGVIQSGLPGVWKLFSKHWAVPKPQKLLPKQRQPALCLTDLRKGTLSFFLQLSHGRDWASRHQGIVSLEVSGQPIDWPLRKVRENLKVCLFEFSGLQSPSEPFSEYNDRDHQPARFSEVRMISHGLFGAGKHLKV